MLPLKITLSGKDDPEVRLTVESTDKNLAITSAKWQVQPVAGAGFSDYDGPGQDTTSILVSRASHGGQSFRAEAALSDGITHHSDPVMIPNPAPARGGGGDDTDEKEKLPWPELAFVATTGVVLGVAALAFVLAVGNAEFGQDFQEREGGLPLNGNGVSAARTTFAMDLAKPLLQVGAVLLAAGLWMTLIEWRARFVKKSEMAASGVTTKAMINPATLIDALGKLKGATLVLVAGVVVLLGPAWIGASAVDDSPPASPSPTSPTGSPTGGTPGKPVPSTPAPTGSAPSSSPG